MRPICLVRPLPFVACRFLLKARGRAGSILVHNQVGCTGQHVDAMSVSETASSDLKTLASVCAEKEKDNVLQCREIKANGSGSLGFFKK